MPISITLTLAHSPDPDDVYMWWPITGMIDPPRDAQVIEPAHIISPPAIDTCGVRFQPIAADIAVLNRRALASADLDITALSINGYAHVRDRYQLTAFGSSMGMGYGPKVVAHARRPSELADLFAPDALIAIPGRQTTAYLMLCMMLGERHAKVRTVEMPFDHILDAAARNTGGVTHGLLIHQSQLTFADLGLRLIADVGDWWLRHSGLPLPLGGNAVRRDLDARFGPGTTARVVDLLSESLHYARARHDQSLEYAMRFAPELDRASTQKYLDMYVSDLTVDAGEVGRSAIQRLLDEGAALGLCPVPGLVDLLQPSTRSSR